MTYPPANLDSDLAAIMEAGDFDEPMVFAPAGAKRGRRIRGIFHAPTGEESPGGVSAPILAQSYSATLSESQLGRRPKRDDQVKARGQAWRVWRVHTDGQGLITLGLQKVTP